MNKQVLSPFDCDMCAMIEDITKQSVEVTASDTSIRLSWAQNGSDGNDTPEAQRIEALKQAIRGRLNDRFIEFFYTNGIQSVFMKYDPTEYPEEKRDFLVAIDPKAGQRYCRTLQEVTAMQVDRERLEELQKFTGGGAMTIPRTPGAIAKYEFKDNHGIILTAPEYSYIVREESGKIYVMDYREFIRDYEPKHFPNKWEKADKTFDRYPDGTKAKGTAGEMWVKVPGGWKDEKTGTIDPYLGANWTGEILIP